MTLCDSKICFASVSRPESLCARTCVGLADRAQIYCGLIAAGLRIDKTGLRHDCVGFARESRKRVRNPQKCLRVTVRCDIRNAL